MGRIVGKVAVGFFATVGALMLGMAAYEYAEISYALRKEKR